MSYIGENKTIKVLKDEKTRDKKKNWTKSSLEHWNGFKLFNSPCRCITTSCVSSADSKIPKSKE